jgi:DNA-binding MarR family transcriptional regulator
MIPDAPTLTIARLGRLLENSSTTDLPFPQFRVLGLLAGGDERASQLASRLAVAKPTLTAIVDCLVERGYVTRETARGDRRVVRLSITEAGREAVRVAGLQLREVLDQVVERCAHPDAVLAALDEIRQALDTRWAGRLAEQPVAAARRGA